MTPDLEHALSLLRQQLPQHMAACCRGYGSELVTTPESCACTEHDKQTRSLLTKHFGKVGPFDSGWGDTIEQPENVVRFDTKSKSLGLIYFNLRQNDDENITCIVCRHRKCDLDFVVRGSGVISAIGCHSRCLDTLYARNQIVQNG